jgi:hypothetical protein
MLLLLFVEAAVEIVAVDGGMIALYNKRVSNK